MKKFWKNSKDFEEILKKFWRFWNNYRFLRSFENLEEIKAFLGKFLENFEKICWKFQKNFEKFGILETISADKFWWNYRENLTIFNKKYVKILKNIKFLRNFEKFSKC